MSFSNPKKKKKILYYNLFITCTTLSFSRYTTKHKTFSYEALLPKTIPLDFDKTEMYTIYVGVYYRACQPENFMTPLHLESILLNILPIFYDKKLNLNKTSSALI